MSDKATGGQLVLVGKIVGVHGLSGWLKVESWTDPRELIVNYSPWILSGAPATEPVEVLAGLRQGRGVRVKLKGVEDRDTAESWVGAEISIRREQLPEIGSGEYYWRDLVGLRVETVDKVLLGQVERIFETGANDVLVLKDADGKEYLVPWLRDEVIKDVDLDAGLIQIDWDPEY